MSVSSYDYIIVGGGTAGLTLANRLTEDSDISVIVLEAGKDTRNDPLVLTPGLMGAMAGKPAYDWNFTSLSQQGLNGRQIVNPSGKQLGGSSALNYMMLLYPTRRSIDAWQEMGNEGWNYKSLHPYLQKFATVHPPSEEANEVPNLSGCHHSPMGNGPVQVSYGEGYSVQNSAWMDAFANIGLQLTADPRGGEALGAFQQPATIDPHTKTRSYAATAHYTASIARRGNLTVMTETIVSKILFETNGPQPAATGVLCQLVDGTERTIHSTEVILAAGAFMTPQLLELSGIGSSSILGKFNIPVLVENPAVGENLQDHPLTAQAFEVNPDAIVNGTFAKPMAFHEIAKQYDEDGGGLLGQCNISVAYVPLADGVGVCSAEDKNDLLKQYESQLKTTDDHILYSLLKTSDEPTVEYLLFPAQAITVGRDPTGASEEITPTLPQYITILTLLNHPFSRGNVHISSTSVHDLPTWDPNFNSHALDVEITARHVQFAAKVARTDPLSQLLNVNAESSSFNAMENLEVAKEVVRQSQISCFHTSGSCAMRPRNDGGVVDTRLRVYGVSGLRVIDASIFPLVPVGNIQSVVYAVAEMAADIVKQDRKLNFKSAETAGSTR